MAVMAAQRKRKHAKAEAPPEPVPVVGERIEVLLDLWKHLDTGHHRAEILEGQLIVSPTPVIWHEKACQWLLLSFLETCNANDWFADSFGAVYLPPTESLIVPDLMILRDESTLPDDEEIRPLDRVLLTAEVISPSSVRRDREVKPEACALAGIPLYLLVDRFTEPLTVSLHSEPGENGYAKIDTVAVGEKLKLPDPFGLTLDTSTLPLPKPGEKADTPG